MYVFIVHNKLQPQPICERIKGDCYTNQRKSQEPYNKHIHTEENVQQILDYENIASGSTRHISVPTDELDDLTSDDAA